MTRYEYPIINVDAENEHFVISDSVISWMESCRATRDENSKNHLSDILPSPATHHKLSALRLAWNLVKIFSEKQGLANDIVELASASCEREPLNEEAEFSYKLSHIELIKGYPSNLTTSTSPMAPTIKVDRGSVEAIGSNCSADQTINHDTSCVETNVRMRGTDEWAPPRAQIIFNIHEETNFKKLMQRQNYRCSGCGTKIDLELARRLVLYCHYLGKYFCKCCFSHKAIHLPGYIVQKWDFHKYQVSHFALQLLDRIANEPLFNIDDINPSLYRKVKKLKHLVDIRMQLYYLRIYISTCPQIDKLNIEYATFTHQHLLQDDVHVYSLNNLIEIQHGKLYEYLNDLVARSIAHIAQCDRCRAKGHYCQLCGPSSLMSSMILSSGSSSGNNNQHQTTPGYEPQFKLRHSNSIGQGLSNSQSVDGRQVQGYHSRSSSGNISNFSPLTPATTVTGMPHPANDHELIFPFEIGRVAQCRACGCCFHLQCFKDAGQNCPKCERIQRRKAECPHDGSGSIPTTTTTTTANDNIDSTQTPVGVS